MDIVTLNEILGYVDSPYLVDGEIVVSGQRKVYSAKRDGAAGRFVLKITPHHPITIARIKREIKILSEIESKYFPKFFFEHYLSDEVIGYFLDDLDPKTQQGRIEEIRAMNIKPFFVTVEEFIDHVPWDKCMSRLREEKILLKFLLHLFEALKLLWAKKIVHRDLKPENILIRPSLEPVVIDLGIAKNLSDGATNLTAPFLPSPCTPQFASPEQLRVNNAEVNYKSDQFAVGVILFWLLTERFPYGRLDEIGREPFFQNLLTEKIHDFRKYNRTLSDGLAELIGKLLKVQQHQRFRTGEEITEELHKIEEAL